MVVTSLRQISNDRLIVCFEDGSEVKSSLGVITELRIFQGKDLDNDEKNALLSLSQRAYARDKAVELVSRQPMSCKELRDKLLHKDFDEDTAEYCVNWLIEHRLISDEAYSQAVARHYADKGYGIGRIKSELSKRGINREFWDEAIDSMPDTTDKLDRIISSKLKDPNNRDEVRKLSQSLYRRGFGWDEIRSAMLRLNAYTEE